MRLGARWLLWAGLALTACTEAPAPARPAIAEAEPVTPAPPTRPPPPGEDWMPEQREWPEPLHPHGSVFPVSQWVDFPLPPLGLSGKLPREAGARMGSGARVDLLYRSRDEHPYGLRIELAQDAPDGAYELLPGEGLEVLWSTATTQEGPYGTDRQRPGWLRAPGKAWRLTCLWSSSLGDEQWGWCEQLLEPLTLHP